MAIGSLCSFNIYINDLIGVKKPTQPNLKLLSEVPRYDLYYSLTHPLK
jgi:hypothetical protein